MKTTVSPPSRGCSGGRPHASLIVTLLLSVATVPSAATATLPDFAAARTLQIPGSPFALATATGDFNHDGIPDFALVNGATWLPDSFHSTLSVYLGRGDGTFAPGLQQQLPILALDLLSQDLDGDGNTDLVLAGATSRSQIPAVDATGTVLVLICRGDGTFAPATGYSAGSRLGSLAAGDLNHDGRPDLVAGDLDSHDGTGVHVLLNRGSGEFESPTGYAVGDGPAAVALGDLDEDGNLDVVVANLRADTVSILRGTGTGGLQPRIDQGTLTGPGSIALADLEGTGHLGLIVGAQGGMRAGDRHDGGLQWFPGDGKGGLGAPAVLGAARLGLQGVSVLKPLGPERHAHPDLVVSDGARTLVIRGDLTPSPHPLTALNLGPVSGRIATADFDGDGQPDLVAPNTGLFYAPSYDFFLYQSYLASPHGLVSIAMGGGEFVVQTAPVRPLPAVPFQMTVRYRDGDSHPDLLLVDNNGNEFLLPGNGDGSFMDPVAVSPENPPPQWQNEQLLDVNHDGIPDRIRLLGGTSGVPGELDPTFPELLPQPGGVSIGLGRPDNTFADPVEYRVTQNGASGFATGDFNEDGHPDIAVVNYGCPVCTCEGCPEGFDLTGHLWVLPGNGDGTFRTLPPVAAGTAPNSVIAVDLDGDGHLDLAVANDDGLVLMSGNGEGRFTREATYTAGGSRGGPNLVAAADFNGDGYPDLVVVSALGATMVLNTGHALLPRLRVERTPAGLLVSWPYPSSDYTLESTTLLDGHGWSAAPEPSTHSGTRMQVAVQMGSGPRYFRLQKP